MTKREKGEAGEGIAARYLETRGYSIIARNYHSRYGEIDIIAIKGDSLAFVEVKLRSSTAYGSPAEAVTKAKMRKIIATAQCYVQSNLEYIDCFMRFDIIGITGKEMYSVNYIENAFSLNDADYGCE